MGDKLEEALNRAVIEAEERVRERIEAAFAQAAIRIRRGRGMLVFRRLVALPLFLCALPLVLLGTLGIAVWMFADHVYGPLGPAQPQADREG